MYNNIRRRASVPKLYEQQLVSENTLAFEEEGIKMRDEQFAELERQLQTTDDYSPNASYHLEGNWKGIQHVADGHLEEVDTGVDRQVLVDIGRKSVSTLDEIKVHPRLQKYHIDARIKKLSQGDAIDWATAEALAFGTLLKEGYDVRISGQDVGRGTFSQRHVMFVDNESEKAVVPLNHMFDDQNAFIEVTTMTLLPMR